MTFLEVASIVVTWWTVAFLVLYGQRRNHNGEMRDEGTLLKFQAA